MTQRATLWRTRKLQHGLCGYCGKRPLSPRSRLRCAACLEENDVARLKHNHKRRLQEEWPGLDGVFVFDDVRFNANERRYTADKEG